MGKILYFLTMIFTVGLILLFNGNIQLTKDPLPPFGKFFNPFGGVWSSGTANETRDITLSDHALKSKVEVIYDERRVPHIFADNMEDALFAQGYVEAQNRLFQMQFLAKVAAGELSSFMGSRTIEVDLSKRRRGMKYAAENAIRGWEKHKDYNAAFRYVDGVNAYIQSLSRDDYPMEFKLFDLEPEKWDALKSALIFKQMSQTLAGRNDDVENTNLLHALGKEDFELLYPEHEDIENPVIPTEKAYAFDTLLGKPQNEAAFYKEAILNSYFENRNKGVGSNSWAVHGSKTATGKPILCNDPHLSLGLPSIWFEVHIHTPEFNAYGVSFPGFPGIMIGFNEYIAWGETNVGQDVEDIFVINWTDSKRTRYLYDGEQKDVHYRIEEIKVKGGRTIIDTVRYTEWGPVFNTSQDGKHDLALRWLCHDQPDTDEYNVFIDAMRCKNYAEYKQVTGKYITPAQNFTFASKTGDIALRVNGRFPAKYANDGRFAEYGDQSSNGWKTWIPRDQNPQIINPQRGFVASANQVSADKTYPYYFTGKFERYRNRSVNGKLASMDKITADDMKKMQHNAYSHKAADFTAMLQTVVDKTTLSDNEKSKLQLLTEWDFQYRAQSEAPVIFDIFYKKLSENTWDELIDLRKKMDLNLPESWRLLELIKTKPDHRFFDVKATAAHETAADVVNKSFKEAVAELEKRRSEGSKNTWGAYKPLDIHHLTRLPALSVTGLEADGCPDAINATGISFGPSWRMVVSLENEIKAYGVYPGGQSGNPGSRYYKNMIDPWMKGEYFPLNLMATREQLLRNKQQAITLNPVK